MQTRRSALRLSLIYFIFSGLWIIGSDRIALYLESLFGPLDALQTYKGLFFISLTTILLFILIRREERIQEKSALALQDEAHQRMVAYQALQAAEDNYTYLFNHLRDAVFLYDVEGSRPGKLIEVNETACAWLGYSREELLHMGRADLSPDEERENIFAVLQKNLEKNTFESETRLVTRYGKVIPVSVNAQRVEWQGKPSIMTLMRDISERRVAENALMQTSRRLQVLHEIDRAILMAQSPEEIACIALNHLKVYVGCKLLHILIIDPDGQDGSVFSLGSSGQVATGRPGKEILAKTGFIERMKTGVPLVYQDLDVEGSPYGVIFCTQENRIRSCANFPLIVQGEMVGVINLLSEQSHHFSVAEIEVAREVSDQLAIAIHQSQLAEQVARQKEELEQRVRERTAELEDLNKELQTFAHSVSHDLKAPLRGIDGYSMLLLNDHGAQLDAEGQAFLQNIRRATAQMGQLIDDLLAYSHLNQHGGEKNAICLRELIDVLLLDRSEDLQAHGFEVEVDLECNEIQGDWDTYLQVFRNLLDNAIKFSIPNAHPRIWIRSMAQTGTCLVSIQDNGIGFNMRYHDRIFGMFQRLNTAEEFPGTGIGLAMVRQAVQRMGGRVWAESQPDQGSTFFLEIPQ